MHFDRDILRKSHYLYDKFMLNALFLSLAAKVEGPLGLVGIVRVLDFSPWEKTAFSLVSVYLKRVRHP